MQHTRSLLAIIVLLIVLIGAGCAAPTDGEQAQAALARYFTLLHQGDYAAAAELYGGPYDILADWNPAVSPDDHALLLELGCTVNGLQCLPASRIEARPGATAGVFPFSVQFENADGSLFVMESVDAQAASATPVAPTSDFTFAVLAQGDDYVVQELPVYVP